MTMSDNGTIDRRRASVPDVTLGPLAPALAAAGDGACVVGADGRIVLWNRAAEKMLGYPAREALGRPCCDVFVGHDDDGNRLCYQGCHIMKLMDLGETIRSFDMKTRSKAGQPVWLNVSILRLPEAGPSGAATVHLFRDVTADKELLTLVHERRGRAPAREPGHRAQSRPEPLRQARRPQPPRSRRLRHPPPTALAPRGTTRVRL